MASKQNIIVFNEDFDGFFSAALCKLIDKEDPILISTNNKKWADEIHNLIRSRKSISCVFLLCAISDKSCLSTLALTLSAKQIPLYWFSVDCDLFYEDDNIVNKIQGRRAAEANVYQLIFSFNLFRESSIVFGFKNHKTKEANLDYFFKEIICLDSFLYGFQNNLTHAEKMILRAEKIIRSVCFHLFCPLDLEIIQKTIRFGEMVCLGLNERTSRYYREYLANGDIQGSSFGIMKESGLKESLLLQLALEDHYDFFVIYETKQGRVNGKIFQLNNNKQIIFPPDVSYKQNNKCICSCWPYELFLNTFLY